MTWNRTQHGIAGTVEKLYVPVAWAASGVPLRSGRATENNQKQLQANYTASIRSTWHQQRSVTGQAGSHSEGDKKSEAKCKRLTQCRPLSLTYHLNSFVWEIFIHQSICNLINIQATILMSVGQGVFGLAGMVYWLLFWQDGNLNYLFLQVTSIFLDKAWLFSNNKREGKYTILLFLTLMAHIGSIHHKRTNIENFPQLKHKRLLNFLVCLASLHVLFCQQLFLYWQCLFVYVDRTECCRCWLTLTMMH